jgi:hypothetical protein
VRWGLELLAGLGSAGGANFSTRTAIIAFAGIDDILAAIFADCILGALWYAGAATNAIISDRMSHKTSPVRLKIEA